MKPGTCVWKAFAVAIVLVGIAGEVAAQYQRIIDATCSPRVDADGPVQFRPTTDFEPAVPTELG